MDALDILKVCLRRWYIMLPILLGAAGVSFQLVQAEQTTFTAYASYGLIQSDRSPEDVNGDEADPNPLGANDGALIGAALEAQLNSRETQDKLGTDETRGWGAGEVENGLSYVVRIPQFESSYEVRAWGEDERAVRDVVNRVLEAAPGIADELQDRAGAPPSGRYQPFIFAATQANQLPSASGIKLVIAVMGIGVLMGAAWSIVADRILRQVESRRAASRLALASTGPRPSKDRDEPEEPPTQPVKAPAAPTGSPPRKKSLEELPETVGRNGQRSPRQVTAGVLSRGTQKSRRTGGR
jgi:hypothetical protein